MLYDLNNDDIPELLCAETGSYDYTYHLYTIFNDTSCYIDRFYGHIDYEIEYEVDDVVEGRKDFDNFIKSHNVEYKESIRKSKRAYDNRK